MDKLFYLGFFLAILSFLLYFLFERRKMKTDKAMRYFIVFLFVMFFFDALGYIFFDYGYNNGLYNLMSLLEFNILFFFYSKISTNGLTKKILLINTIIYNLVLLFSSIRYGGEVFSIKYNSIAPLFGAGLIGVVLLFYLREILLSDEIINYKRNVFFWITTGLLLYYLGTMPLAAVFNLMKEGSSFRILYKIQYLLTIVMHACFLFGLLWSWKRVK